MNIDDARERMNSAHAAWQRSKSATNPYDMGSPAAIKAYADARTAYEAAKSAPPERRPDRILSMGSLTSHITHFDGRDAAPVTRPEVPSWEEL